MMPRFGLLHRAGLLFGFLLCVAHVTLGQEVPSQAPPVPTGAAAAAATSASPQTVANTTGVVRSEEGVAIPGVAVRLTNTDTNKAWVTWTDESGKFQFPTLPAGNYRVEASQIGFAPASSTVVLPIFPSGPIPIVLHVATLAELEGQEGAPASAKPGSGATKGNAAGANGGSSNGASPSSANAGAGGGGAPGARRGNGAGGRGQSSAGNANAIRQQMAAGGFQETDLTGEASATGQEGQASAQSTEGTQPTLAASVGGTSSSSDSFLLQGTVGQGLSANGPGDFPGGGFGNIAVGGPAGRRGQGGFGGPGGFAGGGFGGRGGAGGGGGRLNRQSVNRIRFGFTDRYDNSGFDARPYAINGGETPKTSHYDERIGANMGGPLKIPHIFNGGDKTFFFVNYQHEIEKSAVDTFSTVPTQDERNGNLCGIPGIQLFSPATGSTAPQTALGCNLATDSGVSLNQAALGLLSYIPLPNVPGQTVQNYQLLGSTPLNSDSLNVHILRTLNAKFNLNGGYNFNSVRSDSLGMFPGLGSHSSTLNQAVTLGLSHNWAPRLVESMQLNWSRSRAQVLSDDSFGTNIAGMLGITGVSTDPINYGVPSIGLTNFSGVSDSLPSRIRNQTLRFSDGVSWTHAKHTMRFGGEIRRIELNSDSDPNPRGQFTFTGLETSELDASGQPVAGTGSDFADYLLGLPESTAVQFGISPNIYLRSWGFVAYGQDDWRMTTKFTLEYGLRYEAVTPPVELFGHLSDIEFNPAITTVGIVTPGETGPVSGISYQQSLVRGNHGNLEPRLGFAWQPFGKPKTIVRGGYSIFYNESIYNTLARELAYQAPFATSQSLLTSSAQVLTLENGFPVQPNFVTNTEGVNPDYKNGYAQLWTIGTETDLAKNWIMNLTYTGTKGTNLDLLRIPNRAPLGTPSDDTQESRSDPNATGFIYDQSGANSIYNALQVRVVHRFTSGFMLQGIYTFAKSLDNASSIGGVGTAAIVQNDGDFAAERGLSSFDVRHQVRLNSLYELPFGDRKRWANHGWEDRVFGNWRLLNNITWQTGTPYTAILGGNASDNGTGTNFSLRAEQIGNPNVGVCGGSLDSFFNTSVFAQPETANGVATYGNEHRGSIEGPCSFSWNMSINRSFRFGSSDRRRALDARWEVQNLTNTPNFGGLVTTFNSSLFGHLTSAGSMRTMDFTMRVNF